MIHTVHSSMASFFQPRRLLHLQHPRVRGLLREQPSGKAFWGGFGLEEGEFARREWPARGGGGRSRTCRELQAQGLFLELNIQRHTRRGTSPAISGRGILRGRRQAEGSLGPSRPPAGGSFEQTSPSLRAAGPASPAGGASARHAAGPDAARGRPHRSASRAARARGPCCGRGPAPRHSPSPVSRPFLPSSLLLPLLLSHTEGFAGVLRSFLQGEGGGGGPGAASAAAAGARARRRQEDLPLCSTLR